MSEEELDMNLSSFPVPLIRIIIEYAINENDLSKECVCESKDIIESIEWYYNFIKPTPNINHETRYEFITLFCVNKQYDVARFIYNRCELQPKDHNIYTCKSLIGLFGHKSNYLNNMEECKFIINLLKLSFAECYKFYHTFSQNIRLSYRCKVKIQPSPDFEDYYTDKIPLSLSYKRYVIDELGYRF
jgi:hypothetical protein